MLQKIFRHRFGPLAVLFVLVCGISLLTRIVLMIKAWPNLDFNPLNILGIFIIGLFYDIVVWSFFAIPVALFCWLMKDSWYQKRFSDILLKTLFLIIIIILVINAASEIVFWSEYEVRYNFIAVNYLVYTTEVLENIWQSYNMPLILSAVLIASIVILIISGKKLRQSELVSMRFKKRTVFFLCFLLVPLAGYFLVNNSFKNISKNKYVNELAGNGIYEFGTAFWANELDYNRFYVTQNDTTNFKTLKQLLAAPNATFTSDTLSVERLITSDSPEHKWNVVLISVESLSGDYLKHFGNTQNITPYLDSLIPHSLFFENFYATGTRTVRGLEALSLAIPPTPGQSIVRRPDNENMFTIGSVLKSKDYDVKFIYGGNSFFDNMGYFFSHSGYQVIDERDVPKEIIHHTTAWGICDEDMFTQTLNECDKSFAAGKKFFNHIMTVSNHRPYTYPDGRIDIPSASNAIEGGVKYTDYSINKFLKDAKQKPWFANTVFVIVADHCSKSAGKTDLPVNRYRIPCFIYAPDLIAPKIEQRLTSQIDLIPTLLGLMNTQYKSRFLGYDIYKMPENTGRAFISTYQDMGYLKNGKLLILSPQKKVEMQIPDFSSGKSQIVPVDANMTNEAVSWYQGASFLFKNKKY